METFGPTRFRKVVLLKEDLDKIVVCAKNLPDFSETVVGAIIYLTGSQSGYTAGHFYKCVSTTSGKVWVDLTEGFGTGTKELGTGLFVERIVTIADDDVRETDGYLHIYWSMCPRPPINKLVKEVVVRKLREFPINPDDGDQLVGCDTVVRYTAANPYKFYDPADTDADYKYRVFHIYESGWFCWHDCAGVTERVQ